MSDERTPEDHEPAQAELALDGVEDTDEVEGVELSEDAAAADEPGDPIEKPPSEDELDDLLEAAAALDDPDAPDEPEEPTESPSDEEGLLTGEPEAAPAAAALPTSWPDPIPVGAAPAPPTRLEGLTITPSTVILGGLITLAFLLFVTLEPTPRWLLLFAAIIAVLGTDGALRQAWPRAFSRAQDPEADSTPYLFLPALAAIAWPMMIEHNVRGFLVIPAALLAGLAFTAMLTAQLSSVRTAAAVYPLSRIASTAAVYFTAFALFSLSYVLEPDLPAATAAVAVIAAMLGVELFREGQVDPLETLVFAGVTGVILAEARWAMYYVPVGGYLAGLALLLGFFLVTGLLHSHLTRRLNSMVTLEYAGIAGAGVLLVAVAAQAGLG